ncbi:hypothetical protein EDEG_01034 [Edhazardia aedis USNM 41457]|uniref:DNA recombination and repair protein Rad51-like C-terminal domain-containing protein n=1 Tax=Edhazardia aedis (strain USNM 41457) TaxID=1003232 RepID=J9DB75_EDHAE|nr:hypothetical protein EDEG_01034 [Edhazardia aedis USNM 41457]|eukprot:EJW04744.1 hypothetical protein EDEG_01034 [Edhazardia aedis USNM 41457]
MNIKTEGLVEIVGKKGTAKTTFAYTKLKNKKSIIYHTQKVSIKKILTILNEPKNINELKCLHIKSTCTHCKCLDNIYLKFVNTFESLYFSIMYQIELFIINKSIKIILIDIFDALVLDKNRENSIYKDIYIVLNKLRHLLDKYRLEIYIINEFGSYLNNQYTNIYLGFNWDYYINTRLYFSKVLDRRYVQIISNVFHINEKISFRFDENGIPTQSKIII